MSKQHPHPPHRPRPLNANRQRPLPADSSLWMVRRPITHSTPTAPRATTKKASRRQQAAWGPHGRPGSQKAAAAAASAIRVVAAPSAGGAADGSKAGRPVPSAPAAAPAAAASAATPSSRQSPSTASRANPSRRPPHVGRRKGTRPYGALKVIQVRRSHVYRRQRRSRQVAGVAHCAVAPRRWLAGAPQSFDGLRRAPAGAVYFPVKASWR